MYLVQICKCFYCVHYNKRSGTETLTHVSYGGRKGGQDRTGQDWTGHDRTGQDRTGEGRTEKNRTRQNRKRRIGTGQGTAGIVRGA